MKIQYAITIVTNKIFIYSLYIDVNKNIFEITSLKNVCIM